MLLAGLAFTAAAAVGYLVLLEAVPWLVVLAAAGALLTAWGAVALRARLAALLRRRQVEIALFTAGQVGLLLAIGYLSVHYPLRFDLTEAGLHSLSPQTVTMLRRLERPVHIVFFHDPLMRETVELYKLVAGESEQVTVEFHDPTLNPARARMLGVQFAGTAVLSSGERRLQVHGDSETDIANGILRVSQGARQRVCFLQGHREADPFSQESHDHVEGAAGHSHGLGAQFVLHEQHGMAKARHALETTNYSVAAVSLLQRGAAALEGCALLVVAGPKTALLPAEVAAVRAYLVAGGNGFFLLDPFVHTGLEPLLREFGVVLDEAIVLDQASHFWTDASAPAVTSYNRHQVTRELPLTFYPGVRPLSPTPDRVAGAAVTPIVSSSPTSYAESDPARAAFDPAHDRRGPHTLMVLVNARPTTAEDGAAVLARAAAGDAEADRTEQPVRMVPVTAASRLAVVGDSDFATNSFFHFLGNGNLFLNTVSYLTAQEDLIGIEPRTYDLPRLSLTNRQMKATFVLAVLLLPALLAVIGTAVWWRRR